MGMFEDALKRAAPGGNLTKPLIIAAGALILAKWLGGGREQSAGGGAPQRPDEIMPPSTNAPLPTPSPRAGRGQGQGQGQGQPESIDINAPRADEELPGGLGGLLEKLRKGGLAEEADSWVSKGPNKPVAPGKLGSAIGEMTIKEIAERAGTTQEDILDILTQVLPQLVDNLTPQGRVPTSQDVRSYGRGV